MVFAVLVSTEHNALRQLLTSWHTTRWDQGTNYTHNVNEWLQYRMVPTFKTERSVLPMIFLDPLYIHPPVLRSRPLSAIAPQPNFA